MAEGRKAFLLRLPPELWAELEKWAADELRSVNAQIEYLLRDAVQIVRHDTIRRRVEIRFALTHETLIVVGDRVQLQQVALNLVLNALEAFADVVATRTA